MQDHGRLLHQIRHNQKTYLLFDREHCDLWKILEDDSVHKFNSNRLIKLTNKQNVPKVDSFIVYDTKKIPSDNSANSGINNVYLYETATIRCKNDYINIYALYPDSGSIPSGVTTVPTQIFSVNSATGIFKNVKNVLIDYDNNGTATWNKNNIKFLRRLTFKK